MTQDWEVEPKSWPEAVLDSEGSVGPSDRRNQLFILVVASRKTFPETKGIESLLHWPGTQNSLPPSQPKGIDSSNLKYVCAEHSNKALPPPQTCLALSKDGSEGEGKPSLALSLSSVQPLSFDMGPLDLVASRLWGPSLQGASSRGEPGKLVCPTL